MIVFPKSNKPIYIYSPQVDHVAPLATFLARLEQWLIQTLPGLGGDGGDCGEGGGEGGSGGRGVGRGGGVDLDAAARAGCSPILFVTDGPWDLHKFLHEECERKGIPKPWYE